MLGSRLTWPIILLTQSALVQIWLGSGLCRNGGNSFSATREPILTGVGQPNASASDRLADVVLSKTLFRGRSINSPVEFRCPIFANFCVFSPPSKNQSAITPSISGARSSSLDSSQLLPIPFNDTPINRITAIRPP